MRTVSVALIAFIASGVSCLSAGALFPAPIHLTRQVHDPLSGQTTVLNEYGYGNRLISVQGGRTSIADYEKGELTEIDRDAGTYSITRFEAIAKATQAVSPPSTATASQAKTPLLRNATPKATKSGRGAEFFVGTIDGQPLKQTIEVAVDRSVTLSKDALEVLLGSAYPGVRRGEHDLILAAAAPSRLSTQSQGAASASSEPSYALPIEQMITYELEGQKLEYRTSVVRVGSEPAPADIVSIPAGARMVVSRIVAVSQEIDQINHPTSVLPRVP